MQDYNVNQSKNANNKKKTSAVITLLLAIMLLVTSTFAWKDYRQHKTNVMSGKGGLNRDVVLVEDFDPNGDTVQDWQEGTIDKKVSVKNNLEGKAYVRLTLGEFMALGSQNYKYTDLRYMLDQQGDYIRSYKVYDLDGAIAELQSQLNDSYNGDLKLTTAMVYDTEDTGSETLEHLEGKRIYKVTELEGQSAYYVATRKGDANGQYGKHIPVGSIGANTSEIIVGGGHGSEKVRPNDEGVGGQHHLHGKNADCERYDEIFFDQVLDQSLARDYIDLVNDPLNVVSLKEYVTNKDNYKNGVWVYIDDQSVKDGKAKNQSYVYWSNALTSTLQKDEIERQHTTNILDQLHLHTKPADGFDYFLHVDMEAISHDELGLWGELPQDLKDQYDKEEGKVYVPERPNPWPSVNIGYINAEVDGEVIQGGDNELLLEGKDKDGNVITEWDVEVQKPVAPGTEYDRDSQTLHIGDTEEGPITIVVKPHGKDHPTKTIVIDDITKKPTGPLVIGNKPDAPLSPDPTETNTWKPDIDGGSEPHTITVKPNTGGSKIENGELIIGEKEFNPQLEVEIDGGKDKGGETVIVDVKVVNPVTFTSPAKGSNVERNKTTQVTLESHSYNGADATLISKDSNLTNIKLTNTVSKTGGLNNLDYVLNTYTADLKVGQEELGATVKTSAEAKLNKMSDNTEFKVVKNANEIGVTVPPTEGIDPTDPGEWDFKPEGNPTITIKPGTKEDENTHIEDGKLVLGDKETSEEIIVVITPKPGGGEPQEIPVHIKQVFVKLTPASGDMKTGTDNKVMVSVTGKYSTVEEKKQMAVSAVLRKEDNSITGNNVSASFKDSDIKVIGNNIEIDVTVAVGKAVDKTNLIELVAKSNFDPREITNATGTYTVSYSDLVIGNKPKDPLTTDPNGNNTWTPEISGGKEPHTLELGEHTDDNTKIENGGLVIGPHEKNPEIEVHIDGGKNNGGETITVQVQVVTDLKINKIDGKAVSTDAMILKRNATYPVELSITEHNGAPIDIDYLVQSEFQGKVEFRKTTAAAVEQDKLEKNGIRYLVKGELVVKDADVNKEVLLTATSKHNSIVKDETKVKFIYADGENSLGNIPSELFPEDIHDLKPNGKPSLSIENGKPGTIIDGNNIVIAKDEEGTITLVVDKGDGTTPEKHVIKIVKVELDIKLKQGTDNITDGSKLKPGTYQVETTFKSSSSDDEAFHGETRNKLNVVVNVPGVTIDGKTLTIDKTAPAGTQILFTVSSTLRPVKYNKTIQFEVDKQIKIPSCPGGVCDLGADGYGFKVIYDATLPANFAKNKDLGIPNTVKLLATDTTLNEKELAGTQIEQSNGGTKFHAGADGNTKFSGYDNSQVKTLMENFYNNNIGEDYKGAIVPAVVKSEAYPGGASYPGWIKNTNKEYFSKPNSDEGNAPVFAMSVQDINLLLGSTENATRQEILRAANGGSTIDPTYWLRSPGNNSNNAIYVDMMGYVGSSQINFGNGLRPALWVDFGS